MGIFSNSSPFDNDVEKATSENNTSEEWGVIMEICDKVGSSSVNAKDCLRSIVKRLHSPDPHIVLQAVTLLDACVNNCGKTFQLEVASRDFDSELKKLVAKWQCGDKVGDRIRNLIKKWSDSEFKSDTQLSLMTSLYSRLRQEGVDFSTQSEPLPKAQKSTDPICVSSQQEVDDIAKAIELSLKESTSPTYNGSAITTRIYPSVGAIGGGSSAVEAKKVKALYDFEAAEDNELTFFAGEIIHVLDDSDANWWKGYNKRGEGLFPANFVTSNLAETPVPEKKGVQFNESVEVKQMPVTEIDEEKIDRVLQLLHDADPRSDHRDSDEMRALEDEVTRMGPLIDAELERVDRHKEWRKVAKKMRRKKIRSGLAQQRDELEMEEEEKRKMSPTYEKLVAEEKSLLIAAEEAEMKELEEKLRKWQEEEERVREETTLREALLKELEEKNEKARIKKIEAEKQLVEEEEEKNKRITDCLQQFASGVIDILPDDMLVPLESQPGKEKCLFFNKVAACKFWDACSRNHLRPAVSKVLLFPGFYTHFSMSLLVQSEYDTDMSLEFDEKETYSHFEEFYQDIRSEFEKYGRLTNLLVCCNRELHLRGNVYVSYSTEREAMTAFLKFNGRYYAGRVISCHFVNIPSWKSAVCGLYFKQKCPKGDACNFLHVFKDPGPPFYKINEDKSSSSDEWRWSVSPENDRSNDYERKGNDKKRTRRMQRSRSRSPDCRRSRSSERRLTTSYNKHKSSRKKEFTENCKKRSIEQKRKLMERSGRSHSRDRNRSHPSDKRCTYRDKHSSRKLKSKRTRTNRRSRSRSLSRDNKRKRGEESTYRRSTNKNNSKYKERSKNRSSSSSSGSSDDETLSGKSSVNSHN